MAAQRGEGASRRDARHDAADGVYLPEPPRRDPLSEAGGLLQLQFGAPPQEAPLDYAANSCSRVGYSHCYGPSTIPGAATYNWGPCGINGDGVIYSRSEVKLAQITDGTSNTLMLGEKYLMTDHYYSGLEPSDDGTPYAGHGNDVVKSANASSLPMQDRDGYLLYVNFGSAHDNGCHFALCDGSVRMLNYSIDPTTYGRLGSRNDGYAIDGGKF